ncbi:MAG TPA: hypothetical protein VHW23_22680 [Kofleriaceae bacterium]|jgi:hypothetical protein|nr:hypothetical protein [Kofleriaceae bacterium]
MHRLLPLLLLLALHGTAHADDCQKMFDRSRPVLVDVMKESGKTWTDALAAQGVAQCRKAPHRDPLMDCVLAAADTAAVRACWKTGLESYRTDAAAIEGKVGLHSLERQLKSAFADKGAFVAGKVGLTPKTPCCSRPGQTCPRELADWNDPVWQALDFAPDTGRFRYSYESDGKTVTATAVADLACDGHPYTFTLTAKIDHGNVVTETVSSADHAPAAAATPAPPSAPAAPIAITSKACGPLRAGSKLTDAALHAAFPGATVEPSVIDNEPMWGLKDAAIGLRAVATPASFTIDQGTIDLFGVKLHDDGTKLAAAAFKSLDCHTDASRPGFVNCELPWLTVVLRDCNPPAATSIPPARLKGCMIDEVWWLPVGRRAR